MSHWIKYFFAFLFTVCGYITANSDSKNIILMETGKPFTEQTWFCSGSGNELQESLIKENWDKGARITSVSYGATGWFVTMSKNTGLTGQSYSYTSSWPKEWIEEKQKSGYAITAVCPGKSKWFVVMSQGSGYTSQVWDSGSISELKPTISKWWDSGYDITHACYYNNNKWFIIASKGTPYSTQTWALRTSRDEMKAWIKEMWNKNYYLQLLEYGDQTYFAVVCKFNDGRSPSQTYIISDESEKKFIKEEWDKNKNIAYLGGGVDFRTASSTSSGGSFNLPREGETIRRQIRGGGLAYASISCTRVDNELRYHVYPDNGMPASGFYVYKHDFNRDGCFVLRRYHMVLKGGFLTNVQWEGSPDGTEVLLSMRDGSITLPNGNVYDKAITQEEANAIAYQRQSILNGVSTVGGGYSGGYTGGSTSTSGNSSAYTTCRICGGNGVCTSCHGSKGAWHDTGYYTGENIKTWIDCSSCHGTGRCFNCHGTGRQ